MCSDLTVIDLFNISRFERSLEEAGRGMKQMKAAAADKAADVKMNIDKAKKEVQDSPTLRVSICRAYV